jgi:GH15 family glucan-1,4-alpha-glucosidase
MKVHLYSGELGRFIRGLLYHGEGRNEADSTLDASLFGVSYFGAFDVNDEIVTGTMKAIEEKLAVGGGVARFENDGYMRVSSDSTGNAWFICTLWLADYHLACAKTKDDLAKVLGILQWVVDAALPSGVLAEQFNPLTGEHVSVSPLTWSHSTFVATVNNFIRKQRTLN